VALLDADTLLPSQWDALYTTCRVTPEGRLALAVIEDALHVLFTQRHATAEDRAEALAWVEQYESAAYGLSFRTVVWLAAPGSSVEALREGILQRWAATVAGHRDRAVRLGRHRGRDLSRGVGHIRPRVGRVSA